MVELNGQSLFFSLQRKHSLLSKGYFIYLIVSHDITFTEAQAARYFQYGSIDSCSRFMFFFCALVIVLIIQFVVYLLVPPVPGLGGQMQLSGLKKSMAAIPCSPQACGSDWVSPDDAVGRQNFASTDHAPLSPQSSVASSGSEQTEDQGSARNTFQEDGSGMKGRTPRGSLTFCRSESSRV